MQQALRAGFLALLAFSARAQLPLTASEAEAANRLFSQTAQDRDLQCHVQVFPPRLDFAFRFEAAYIVRFPLRQFDGEANTVSTFLNVAPQDGKTVLLGETFGIPAIPPAIRQSFQMRRFGDEAEISGVFTVGEGKYRLNLLVIDSSHRAFRKSWSITAAPHGKEKSATIAMPPNTAASAMLMAGHERPNEQGASDNFRLTVLLDAEPIQPASFALRAWDRAFLLESLSSLLSGVPHSTVRLVAFNLDQQVEVFRQNFFRRSDFRKLAVSLRGLELSKVSYRTLQNQAGWSELLAKLVREEATQEKPSDAIIILGPHTRIDAKVPPEMLQFPAPLPRLFYLEYYARVGEEYPDTLQHLTTACRGTVLKLHSPAEFADALQKVQRLLKESSARTAASSGG